MSPLTHFCTAWKKQKTQRIGHTYPKMMKSGRRAAPSRCTRAAAGGDERRVTRECRCAPYLGRDRRLLLLLLGPPPPPPQQGCDDAAAARAHHRAHHGGGDDEGQHVQAVASGSRSRAGRGRGRAANALGLQGARGTGMPVSDQTAAKLAFRWVSGRSDSSVSMALHSQPRVWPACSTWLNRCEGSSCAQRDACMPTPHAHPCRHRGDLARRVPRPAEQRVSQLMRAGVPAHRAVGVNARSAERDQVRHDGLRGGHKGGNAAGEDSLQCLVSSYRVRKTCVLCQDT